MALQLVSGAPTGSVGAGSIGPSRELLGRGHDVPKDLRCRTCDSMLNFHEELRIQCYNFHFGPRVYCLHGVAHLREIPHVSTIFGEKWIHGVSSIYTSAIHYVSDTPRVSSGYPMYPVYPYVSLCIPMYHPVYPKYMSKFQNVICH